MYYIEVSNGMSPTDAQTNVSQMFLVCSRTVQRWVELWESIGEEALLDGHKEHPACLTVVPSNFYSILYLMLYF